MRYKTGPYSLGQSSHNVGVISRMEKQSFASPPDKNNLQLISFLPATSYLYRASARSIANNKSSQVTSPWRGGQPLGGLARQGAPLTLKGHELSLCFISKNGVYLSGRGKSLNTSQEIKGIDTNEHVISARSNWVRDNGMRASSARGDGKQFPSLQSSGRCREAGRREEREPCHTPGALIQGPKE